ncbi:MAG: DNA-binding protein [Candidatus Hermodarchaeota archaeon]
MSVLSDEELDEIRRRKLASLREEALEEQVREQQIAEAQAQKEAILRQILTPEARSRLTNIRMVKPQVAEQIELQLIQLASSGRLRARVTDEQLKKLLQQITGKERERKISFR